MEIPVSHIEIVDGNAVIQGRNIKVRMVAGMYLKAGATIEQVMEQYDLSRAEVHAALAYYYDNQAAFEQEEDLVPLIEEARQASAARLERMRAKAKSRS
jgi:uncharacterized protein (DUF433 family)